MGPLLSPKGNGEAVDKRGADLEFRVCRGQPLFVPLSSRGAEFLRLLDKESITQRLSYLGEQRKHGWVRDVRGWCQTPLALWPTYRPGYGSWTLYLVPCRKCAGCIRSRQGNWASRAGLECAVASRTWLVTLTLGPEARDALRASGAVPGDPASSAKGAVTLLFDRLRHSHGVRYLCALERHKDGTPHWHALVHEPARKLRYRDFQRQWGLGFIHAKLVREGEHGEAAAYVAKYLTKEAGRVRASRRYGVHAASQIGRPLGQAEDTGEAGGPGA